VEELLTLRFREDPIVAIRFLESLGLVLGRGYEYDNAVELAVEIVQKMDRGE
jgi:hypothetical protein